MARTDRSTGLVGDTGIKEPVVAATTAAITLSGEQTIDGVAVVDGNRVLVKDQASGVNNGIYCVDPHTEILTKNGFKRHTDLADGEDVFTLNLDTGNAEWQPLLSVHSFHVENIDMLSMEGNCHSSLSTMNHRWPVSKRHAPSDQYPRQRYADGTFAPWAVTMPEHFLTIRESQELNSEDYLVLAAKCSNLPQNKKYEDAFVELVGWFITEGHIRKNNSGRVSNGVRIVQSIAVNPGKVERIRRCLVTLFGEPSRVMRRPRHGQWKPEWRSSITKNGRMMDFSLNREAGKLLCEVAPGKVLKSEFVASLTEQQLGLFVDTCIAADGHISNINGQRMFTQKRLDMLAPVQMACTLLGIPTNVSLRDHGIHVMTLLKRERALPQQKSKTIGYSGTVWCPKTENSTWLARRDGSVYFTGNTVDTGTWTRTKDMDGSYDLVQGSLVYVYGGTTNGNKIFKCTTANTITIGTSSLVFSAMDIELTGSVKVAWCGTATGTANALVLTPAVAVASLSSGLTLLFKSGASANTSTATIAVSGLTATAAQSNGVAMVGGEIEASKWYMAVYEGTAFQVVRIAPAVLLEMFTTAGDSLIATADQKIARVPATASVAAHATTSDLFTARETLLTGGAVTFTGTVNAPYIGAVAWVYQNAAHVWTDGAVFDVQGNANYTAEIGDWIRLNAVTLSTFDVTVFKANGVAVGSTAAASQAQLDAGVAGNVYIPPSLRKISLLATQATTSGTSKDFTIPAGAREVSLFPVGVSTNGVSHWLIQLGDAGGIETTGCLGAGLVVRNGAGSTGANSTAGFIIPTESGAAQVFNGTITLSLVDAATFTWVASGVVGASDAVHAVVVGGSKSLSAELTTVRLTTVNGTDAFDAGLVGCGYIL